MAKEKLLFVDGCISTHESRTKRLCDAYIERFLEKHPEVSLETFMVREGNVMPFTEERLKAVSYTHLFLGFITMLHFLGFLG